nr:AEC family transporter [Candidatus Saccharibacteria bacterium]
MNTLIYAVLPIFFIVGIGYLARKKDIFKDRWVDALIGYVYYIALPSLIVTSILSITITSNEVVQTLLWVTAFVVGNAILCGAFMKLVNVRKQYQAAFFLAATVGNSVYLGVPLTTTVLHTSSNTHDYSLLVLIGIYQLIASIFIALVANEFIFTSKRNMNNIVR